MFSYFDDFIQEEENGICQIAFHDRTKMKQQGNQ